MTTKVLGISGSLRRGSYNAACCARPRSSCPGLDAGGRAASAASRSTTATSRRRGFRRRSAQLKEAVVAADGVLLVTPEYNNSIPGSFQERHRLAVASGGRYASACSAAGRFALIGASPGAFGTTL